MTIAAHINHAESYKKRVIGHIVENSVLWKQLSHDKDRLATSHLYFATSSDRNRAANAITAAFGITLQDSDKQRFDVVDGKTYYPLYLRDQIVANAFEVAFRKKAPEDIINATRDSGGGRFFDSPVSVHDAGVLWRKLIETPQKQASR